MSNTYTGVDLKNALRHYGRPGMKKGRHLPGTTWWQEGNNDDVQFRPEDTFISVARKKAGLTTSEKKVKMTAAQRYMADEQRRRASEGRSTISPQEQWASKAKEYAETRTDRGISTRTLSPGNGQGMGVSRLPQLNGQGASNKRGNGPVGKGSWHPSTAGQEADERITSEQRSAAEEKAEQEKSAEERREAREKEEAKAHAKWRNDVAKARREETVYKEQQRKLEEEANKRKEMQRALEESEKKRKEAEMELKRLKREKARSPVNVKIRNIRPTAAENLRRSIPWLNK